MTFYFKNFRYDVEKQILYQADNIIPLKRNQAVMLDMFLADSKSIHSKEQILEAVWGDQIVSEQVVFQTISQLRGILGGEAIKTFPKKGYKWELALTNKNPKLDHETNYYQTSGNTHHHQFEQQTQKQANKHSHNKYWWVLAIFVLLPFVFYFSYDAKSEKQPIKIYFLSDNDKQHVKRIAAIEHLFSQHTLFDVQRLAKDISVSQAFTSPQLAWSKSMIDPNAWLMWGEFYALEQQVIFHYGITNKYIQWQGYITAGSVLQIEQAILKRFEQLSELGIFDLTIDSLDVKHIQIMLEQGPDDPDLLLLVAKKNEAVGQYDIALSYLQNIINNKAKGLANPYSALAHWHISNIYKMRGQNLQANNSLDAMHASLQQIAMPSLYFQYVKTKAWLAYSETEHETMYHTLDEGFRYFGQLDNVAPLLKFKLHILYSILAEKVSDSEQKYQHLNQAQALLLKYRLDESNLAYVYYHFALFSQYQQNLDSSSDVENTAKTSTNSYVVYLEKILELPRTLDTFWIHDQAIELLIRFHTANKNFNMANNMLNSRNMTPKLLFLKAQLLLAQNKHDEAQEQLEQAFQKAKRDYDSRTAIESALWLYKLSEKTPKRRAEYLAYLESNADSTWLSQNLILVNG